VTGASLLAILFVAAALVLLVLYLVVWTVARAWGNGSRATECQILRMERDSARREAEMWRDTAEKNLQVMQEQAAVIEAQEEFDQAQEALSKGKGEVVQ
jgi:hypothetical protein